jgi:hypothetical protein
MVWNSVHNKNEYRFKKAISQKKYGKYLLEGGNINQFKEKIIGEVIECLKTLNVKTIPYKGNYKYIIPKEDVDRYGNVDIDYNYIKDECHLSDVRDILWMKFTSSGFLGVVASSNDVNFQRPNSNDDYDKKINGKWKYNSSGIIIHYLGEHWDTTSILMFPLTDITTVVTRHTIEKLVGDYLIKQGIPILDLYSHKIGGK